jgi:peptidylprolyl isomerase
MLRLFLLALTCLPLVLFADEVKEPDLKKLSETFGNLIGRSLKGPGFSFDMESLITGIRNGAAGKPAPLTDQEYEEGMAALQQKLFENLSQENLKKADDFLKENASKKGVKSLDGGKLQYTVQKEGNGAVVPEGGSPEINYVGKTIDGEVFSSTEDMGPIVIDLKRTVPGFNKGIAGMKEGEKRTLYIHPDLAYGLTGQLPPNSLLIFEVEVLKAEKPQEEQQPAEDEVDIEELEVIKGKK